MSRFDLNLLGALDALLSERNVTRAAERLHVTQPTMSGMLQRLRYQFNDQLLVRNGRNMELTPVASALMTRVRDVLLSVESLKGAELRFDPAKCTRTFTITASDYCTSVFLPNVIRRLAKNAPGARVVMQPPRPSAQAPSLAEIDLRISEEDFAPASDQRGEDNVRREFLFSDEFVCVVSNAHPLHDQSTYEDYLCYPHVGVHASGTANYCEGRSRQYAPHFQSAYSVAEFSQVAAMVARTNLVGVVQEQLALIASQTLPIRLLPPPIAIPDMAETMFWHSRHANDAAHGWLRSIVADEARAWRRNVSLSPSAQAPNSSRQSALRAVG